MLSIFGGGTRRDHERSVGELRRVGSPEKTEGAPMAARGVRDR